MLIEAERGGTYKYSAFAFIWIKVVGQWRKKFVHYYFESSDGYLENSELWTIFAKLSFASKFSVRLVTDWKKVEENRNFVRFF